MASNGDAICTCPEPGLDACCGKSEDGSEPGDVCVASEDAQDQFNSAGAAVRFFLSFFGWTLFSSFPGPWVFFPFAMFSPCFFFCRQLRGSRVMPCLDLSDALWNCALVVAILLQFLMRG